MELTHLSYLVRDSLEYCHAQINVTEENFQRAQQIFKGEKLYGMRKISARLYISRKSF